MNGEDPVNLLQRGGFDLARVGPFGRRPANVASAPAQQLLERLVHRAGVRRGFSLRHRVLRHDAVFLDERDEHVPLAAVVNRVRQQVVDGAVVDVAIGELNHRRQKVVRLLELVPKVLIVLGELEFLDACVLVDGRLERVEAGEEPAAAGFLLVRDRPGVDFDGDGRVDRRDDLPVHRHLVDGRLGDGVLHDPSGAIGGKGRGEALHLFAGQRIIGHKLLLVPQALADRKASILSIASFYAEIRPSYGRSTCGPEEPEGRASALVGTTQTARRTAQSSLRGRFRTRGRRRLQRACVRESS